MCLAIPGKVLDIYEQDGLKMARVNFDGIKRAVCVAYTPEVHPGSFVLVHVGFAISTINEAEAKQAYELLKMAGETDEFPPDT